MNITPKILSASVLVLLSSTQICKAENFVATVTLDGITQTLSFATFGEAIDAANNPNQFKDLFPNSSSSIGAVGTLDFKGVPIEFTKPSNDTVTIAIPNIGVSETITIENADKLSDSALNKAISTQVNDLIRSNNASINKELALVDSADPLGGNPSSIMGIMVENAYLLGTNDDWDIGSRKKASTENRFEGGVRHGGYSLDGKSVNSITFPFAYTLKMNDRQQLIVSVPFTYLETQKAASYDGGAGFAYKHRITDHWVLTPAVAYGFRGSFDLADVGHIASGTITSKYTFDLDSLDPNSYKLSIGNMAGYYTTLPYAVDGYSVDPNLESYIFKNGLILSKNISNDFLGKTLNVAANFTDTEYFGSPFFVDQYNELGVSIKTFNDNHWFSAFGFNANYLFSATGKNVEGYRVGLTYQF